jgi:hypothetical protein
MTALIIMVVLAIAGFCAFFVSSRLQDKLVKSGNKNPVLLSALTFIGIFAIVFVAIFLIIATATAL